MQATFELEHPVAHIRLQGHFTFEGQRSFRQATQEMLATPDFTAIHFDLTDVESMDSTALGMLLLLHERAAGRPIILHSMRPDIRAMIKIANTGGIFELR
ncbi:STAS domain-containing protein [Silvimonas iriomotensis]|uniref:STAS domain-containing protein n=1 Tax=Silvimonas iriomotensis TaxID=449662 RepID=A0ABQ2PAS7_9NEIS|nr:STAS domain-containing protein [Silvimonas iriomotensis]GGP22582.1 STAS domain-containing protein [Silvimonas iriomotensis]